eukprot:TRINITY_DN337_c0_g1_i7.p1 TRINITY_DN337_c0_g1~~TRINITY_DN337_c0_g1_i7.p1  ORF type:complete len:427 (+),score=43.72 TRINITY_DN337_c0_g1_i7:202-1482(+)
MASSLLAEAMSQNISSIDSSTCFSRALCSPAFSRRAHNCLSLKWMNSFETSICKSMRLDNSAGCFSCQRSNERKAWQVRMASKVPAIVKNVNLDDRHTETFGAITRSLSSCLTETHLHDTVPGLGPKIRGKVRDTYDAGNYLVLVTTDRQSAFDRVLASVPFKGQVLNEISIWWFKNTRHITENAFVSSPDPNVTIARQCNVFPVEFVVRGYLTGTTSTSIWTVYSNGARNYCGNFLPDGLAKNDCLEANILTPTTKAANHDTPISGEEIVAQGLMSQEEYNEVSTKALALFAFGQKLASEHGLILADTKYEFGKAADGSILLIDEVHTPDSSRYWNASTYEERHKVGLEPENIDKEFLRLWFKDNCDPYKDEDLPAAPPELVTELAWRYILLFEAITGTQIRLPSLEEPVHDRISQNLKAFMACG